MSAGSGEKKRLEQDLLQRRAGAPLVGVIDPRRFQFQPEKIDTIRLRAAQIEAGKTPITERLQKQLKKTRRKARRTRAGRGEVARAVREQKRFEKGERRDKPEEEPRIVGEPKNTGIAYDPDIERRRLDIQERANQDANLRALMDRREAVRAQERELAVRRGELAGARADRQALAAALGAVGAAAPVINVAAPPAPVVNVAAPAVPDINVAPVINLPARADADPIPEIVRLGAEIRGDVDAFGQELERRNLAVLDDVRRQTDEQLRRQQAVEDRQLLVDEELRRQRLRYDADVEEVQQRIGMGEVNMARARDAVIQEIRDAEARLRGARAELDQPVSYDDVILAADRPRIEELEGGGGDLPHEELRAVQQPAPEPAPAPAPQEPLGISGVIQGGGELDLPNLVVERPGLIAPDEPLRLSEEGSTVAPSGEGTEQSPLDLGIPPERLRRGGGRGSGQIETPPTTSEEGEEGEEEQFATPEGEQGVLPPAVPVDVADELRASRLQLPEELPVSRAAERAQERIAAGQPLPGDEERLRLVEEGEQAFAFDPPEQQQSPRSPLPPVRTGEADEALQRLLASPAPSPRPAEASPLTKLEDLFSPEREFGVGAPLPTQLSPRQQAQGIQQFGGAAQPAPPRVIEDAGIQAVEQEPEPQQEASPPQAEQREVRPLDPDVLFEETQEAEEVGQIQDERPQVVRDSYQLFGIALPDLATETRQGPRTGARGQRGGLGYRVRNNTDRTLKKVKPGDVVNITGTDAGTDGRGRFRLDTETATGTRVGLDQFEPLVKDGSFLFEKGHRHELGGHFDENPYGPPPTVAPPGDEPEQAEPGLLQQAAGAVGGAVAGGIGGAARLAGGVAQGAAEGVFEQLPAAGDVGAALGRGAVRAAGAVGGAAVGAVQGALGGGEGEAEPEPAAEP